MRVSGITRIPWTFLKVLGTFKSFLRELSRYRLQLLFYRQRFVSRVYLSPHRYCIPCNSSCPTLTCNLTMLHIILPESKPYHHNPIGEYVIRLITSQHNRSDLVII